MELCHLISLDGRIGWLARLGDRVHDATIDQAPPPAPTISLQQFHAAANAIAIDHGYQYWSIQVQAEIWNHKNGMGEKPTYGVTLVSKGLAIGGPKKVSPTEALKEFRTLLESRKKDETVPVMDMPIAGVVE